MSDNRKFIREQLNNMLVNRYSQPMTTQERLKGGASALPVIGDAISGYDAIQSARNGNYSDAALNAIGLLPFVPGLAGVIKQRHIDDILNTISKEGKKGGSYGLRVIPHGDPTPNIGDILNPSMKWVNGDQTTKVLRGTSTSGLSTLSGDGIINAMKNLGMVDNNGTKPFYMGDDVVLVKGTNRGKGSDNGERLISNAQVLWKSKKTGPGRKDLIE